MKTENLSTDIMNEAIAVFMGGTIDEHGRIHGLSKKGHYRAHSLTYHCSWDSLMPVFEKIKSLGNISYEFGTLRNTDYCFAVIADAKKHKQLVFIPPETRSSPPRIGRLINSFQNITKNNSHESAWRKNE